jgi:hypothetical protein
VKRSALLLVMLGMPLQAQDRAASDLFRKCVEAHGGAKNLQRLGIGKVKYELTGTDLPGLPLKGDLKLQLEETYQMPDQIKKVIKGTLNGLPLQLIWAINKDHWWFEEGSVKDKRKRPPDMNLETQFRPFLFFETLPRLLGREVKMLPDEAEGKQDKWIEVKGLDDNPLRLLIDPDSGLLLKAKTWPPLDPKAWTETTFGDYLDVGRVKVPRKMRIFVRGEATALIQIESVRLLDRIDEKEFAAP